VLGGVALTACSAGGSPSPDTRSGMRASSQQGTPSPVPTPSAAPTGASSPATVAPLRQRRSADVLVVGGASLPAAVRERLAALSGPSGSVAFRAGKATVAGRPLSVVGVDPSSFRPFTAPGTAESDAVWAAVARGEAVVGHEAAERSGLALGAPVPVAPATPGSPAVPRSGAPSAAPSAVRTAAPTPRPSAGASPAASVAALRLGALATTGLPRADLVVDTTVAAQLGVPEASAMLLSAPAGKDPVAFAAQVREVAGTATVDLLTTPAPVARLTGGDVAQDLGAFSYRYFADGSIEPDAAWVRENIRTETVPIFGRVTCHRLMLPQLRGALQDVVDAGLASTLTTYDGCYVPRFIERNPERPISLHTWGIAIDLDAATNYRGIRGTMDERVVAIFKRWGFVWGGDWTYTDPMHFELATLTDPSR
jgi:hypothetical protein